MLSKLTINNTNFLKLVNYEYRFLKICKLIFSQKKIPKGIYSLTSLTKLSPKLTFVFVTSAVNKSSSTHILNVLVVPFSPALTVVVANL